MRKICVITTTRAEYGLLYWLMKALNSDSSFQLQLVVTGTHLSKEFGSTIDKIRDDGFHIDRSFNMELQDDTPEGVTHSLSVALRGFATAFKTLEPDLVVILGDRFEILGAATAALIANIPVAHIHGGELSEGAIDDSIRHATTKIAYFHFTAAETYRKRVIQLGEHPSRVLNVGGLGLDNIKKLPLLSKRNLETELKITFKKHNLLVTYHPETLNPKESTNHFFNLLQVLKELEETLCIFTFPNADTGHAELINLLEEYVRHNSDKAVLFKSLGQLRYLSAMKYVDAVVGNSSSGIIEAPGMNVATINIGNRQKGRLAASSVIQCEPDQESIRKAMNKLYSSRFKSLLKTVENPYGKGGAANRIIKFLKTVNFDQIKPKEFYNSFK
jgi:GDP/UDP-N,N'-diacetylbacillosamine 2-epimerase (hydrolysing)